MHRVFIFLISLVCTICNGQQINLELQEDLNCGSNTLCMDIIVSSADGTPFEIGTSSIFITYNKSALLFNSYESIHFNGSDLCIADAASAWDDHQYDATSVPGELNLTMTLLNNDFSCPSILENTIVSQICFQILDNKADPNIQFHLPNTNFNSAVVNDGTAAISKATMTEISGVSSLQCSTLPIEWLAIEGKHFGGYNEIGWSVAKSSDISKFEILRRVNENEKFKVIGTVDASNNTHYTYKDYGTNISSNYYYKVRQIEKTGEASFSDIVVIRLAKTENSIKVYPNPTDNFLTIDFDLTKKEDIQLVLYSLQGEVVLSKSVIMEDRISKYKLDLANLIPGIYLLETKSNSIQDLQQIIILD